MAAPVKTGDYQTMLISGGADRALVKIDGTYRHAMVGCR